MKARAALIFLPIALGLSVCLSSAPGASAAASKIAKANGVEATKTTAGDKDGGGGGVVRRGRFLIGVGNDMGVNLPGIQLFPGVKYFTDKSSFLLPLLTSNPSPVTAFGGVIVGLGVVAAVVAVLVSVSTMFIGKRDGGDGERNPFRELGPSTFPPLDGAEYDDDDDGGGAGVLGDRARDDIGGGGEAESANSIDGRLPGTASPSGYGASLYSNAKHDRRHFPKYPPVGYGRSFAKRSLDDEDEQGSFSAGESVIRLVELAKEMYDGYDVRSVDCHRRLMCQLSKTEAYRRVGADKAFKFASLVENWVDLPPPVRILVDQLKFAVSFAKSADGLLDGGDGDGAAGAAGTRQSRRVPYYVTGDAAVSENGVPSTGGGGDGGGHDSCDVAFPDCDFSFYQFVRERLFRHRK